MTLPPTISALSSLKPLTLSGKYIRLEPLSTAHVSALANVGLFPSLWALQPAPIENMANMQTYVDTALADQQREVSLPFVIVNQANDEVIGSTRYMDIALRHRRLEIGATWITPSHQRSAANTEAKFLLLTHAFETLGIQRVIFKTETLNQQSRNALLRIGAVEEGIFRKHLLATSGRARDMVYFSILDNEWPAVKIKLSLSLH